MSALCEVTQEQSLEVSIHVSVLKPLKTKSLLSPLLLCECVTLFTSPKITTDRCYSLHKVKRRNVKKPNIRRRMIHCHGNPVRSFSAAS